MIINRFFEVNSIETVIFKVNIKLLYEKYRGFVTFDKNSPTRLLLQQKVAAPPAPALQHCLSLAIFRSFLTFLIEIQIKEIEIRRKEGGLKVCYFWYILKQVFFYTILCFYL
jgi:hypothetical protein